MDAKLIILKVVLYTILFAIPSLSQTGAKWRMGIGSKGFNALQLDQSQGHYHSSIPEGVIMMDNFASDSGFTLTHVRDGKLFTQTNLAKYDVIILNNVEELPQVLDSSQQAAFKWYVETFTGTDGKSQGGVIGWHGSVTLQLSKWKWYSDWIGADYDRTGWGAYDYLPSTNLPTGKGVKADDVALEGVNGFKWNTEFFNWKLNPYNSPNISTVLYLNKSDTEQAVCISWRGTTKKARMFMTTLGHDPETLQNTDVIKHFAGALKWTAGPAREASVISLAKDIEFSAAALKNTYGGFTVHFTKNVPHTITVTSLTGKILAKDSSNQAKLYDFSGRFQAGMYWVKIHTAAGDRVQKVSVL